MAGGCTNGQLERLLALRHRNALGRDGRSGRGTQGDDDIL